MNAQSVWGGHEYAFVEMVRKRHFPMNATRVKVISTRKVSNYGKQRDDTYAKVEFVDHPTRPHREVNVRQLYDFWDSYEDERNALRIEKERAATEAQARLDAIAREREEKQEAVRTIANKLAYKLGIDPSVVTANVYSENVSIRAQDLQFLLED